MVLPIIGYVSIDQLIIFIAVILLLFWRMSYGYNNGLFAEATGLISAFAALAVLYYLIKIAGQILNNHIGGILTRIVYLIAAIFVYKVMSGIGGIFKKIVDIPIIGFVNSILGAILGIVEVYIIVNIIERITDIQVQSVLNGMLDRIVGIF